MIDGVKASEVLMAVNPVGGVNSNGASMDPLFSVHVTEPASLCEPNIHVMPESMDIVP